MAKATCKSTPAPKTEGPESGVPEETSPTIHDGSVRMKGASGLKVDVRVYRPIDVTDWGRPSPKDLYLKEAERRLKDGEVPADMTHKVFANRLREWFIATYPSKRPPAALTIERNTVELWHRYGRG